MPNPPKPVYYVLYDSDFHVLPLIRAFSTELQAQQFANTCNGRIQLRWIG